MILITQIVIYQRGSFGGGGGFSGMVLKWKKGITDHGHKNFVFPNHESMQIRYSL